jgi:hypothetical protein
MFQRNNLTTMIEEDIHVRLSHPGAVQIGLPRKLNIWKLLNVEKEIE